MSKILGFIGAFIFIAYFYGFAGLIRPKKTNQRKNYFIYGLMTLINIGAWIITINLINKYF